MLLEWVYSLSVRACVYKITKILQACLLLLYCSAYFKEILYISARIVGQRLQGQDVHPGPTLIRDVIKVRSEIGFMWCCRPRSESRGQSRSTPSVGNVNKGLDVWKEGAMWLEDIPVRRCSSNNTGHWRATVCNEGLWIYYSSLEIPWSCPPGGLLSHIQSIIALTRLHHHPPPPPCPAPPTCGFPVYLSDVIDVLQESPLYPSLLLKAAFLATVALPPSVGLRISLCVFLSFCLSVSLCMFLSFSLCMFVSFCLSVYLCMFLLPQRPCFLFPHRPPNICSFCVYFHSSLLSGPVHSAPVSLFSASGAWGKWQISFRPADPPQWVVAEIVELRARARASAAERERR